jgi:hypothetical protein
MRCILGLCVVLAVGSPAWTTEMGSVSPEQAPQVPSLAIPTTPASNLPAVTTPSISNLQQVPAQLAPTTASPAPAMTNSGTSVVGAQPGATTTSNTMAPTTYYYPMGTFGQRYRMTAPVYYGAPMYITSGYSTPTQTYNTVPQQQMFYQPVQQRRGLFGLFQPRWRQQSVPVYTSPGYTTSGYANVGYVTPGYTTPAYTPTTYYYYYSTPSGTVPASTVSAGTAPAATNPVYSPTMYTAPNSMAPAGATSAPGTTPVPGTAPAATTPTGTIPSVVNPLAPPAVTLPGTTPK